jgi:ABC-type multidrug transport system fused ATPase/permease subunit
MKNLKTVFLAFREMHRLEKRLIPTAVTVALVTAVMPFVNIWFTSKIIDLLEGGAGMKSLALYIGLAVGINAVLFFINYYLGDMQFVYRSLMYNKELQRISSKLFGMEYQCLENSDFQALVHKHSEAQDRVFSSFVQLTWMMRDFISGALTLLISVVLVVPLFKIGFQTTGASFFERPAFLLTIFGAIAVMAVIILVVAVKMNRAWFQASDEYSRLDRIFYYFLNLFSDYNTGKEIRIYKEQELIKHTATDKLLTEGEGILKKASMNTAKQSSFVAILGALVGFGIYLFIGVWLVRYRLPCSILRRFYADYCRHNENGCHIWQDRRNGAARSLLFSDYKYQGRNDLWRQGAGFIGRLSSGVQKCVVQISGCGKLCAAEC